MFFIYNKNIPKWFAAITLYVFVKIITNYRKCTISYFECKLRNVKKEQGLLYNYLERIVDLRYDEYNYLILLYLYFVLMSYAIDNNIV